MADKTKIEWTEATWNPITGCALASEGCRHCYAARLAATRLKNHPTRKGLARLNAAGEAKFTGEVRFNEKALLQPLRWRKPRLIFPVAHGDLFYDGVPDWMIDRVFAVMALTPQHTYQLLTKRPERARAYLGGDRWAADHVTERLGTLLFEWMETEEIAPLPRNVGVIASALTNGPTPKIAKVAYPRPNLWPLPNVWLGTSVEDQATSDARIPELLATPAALRWISAEPLLGPVDLEPWLQSIDWVVGGGESGPGARPMHPDWARSLRDQCAAADVPFFFKQWGEWLPDRPFDRLDKRGIMMTAAGTRMAEDDVPHIMSGAMAMGDFQHFSFVGKKAAGRLLDGVEHNAMPENAHV